ncbi:(2Fe-2S)-binding protein [Amycolatopsis acidiphila]|uniref:(2Fe-2S)-binding protein n=1 Tax=Amycolatopsis acidiphila TaxID=715473 RepID=A0A558A359_9PSEU|nr:(2Fe-2S)-binding protein [Amycolatopsis acidiphila]TVT18679.1 (2Fe-2S)-binding protein [Amycolatopsis acidiphila]UIJ61583.1 (2Fe-2S)-binding protein [Amycolatopsis acidiphila]GHG59087.1 Fe-S oxidoreductase [Amycolatopsis acidiphila]
MTSVPATSITDPGWLRTQIGLAARRYGRAQPNVLGTIWWYSASSVLIAPTLETFARAEKPLDPSLSALSLDLHDDGNIVGAHSSRPLEGDIGEALAGMIETVVAAVSAVTGAHSPALRAIATDSIANRLLWTGTPALAGPLVAAIGARLPRPRYGEVGGTPYVRRVSCCLIYQATGTDKCLSCPRQAPAERERRLRSAFGQRGQ